MLTLPRLAKAGAAYSQAEEEEEEEVE